MAVWLISNTASACLLPKRKCRLCPLSSPEHSKHCRRTGKFRIPHELKSQLALRSISQRLQTIAKAGHRSPRASNRPSATWLHISATTPWRGVPAFAPDRQARARRSQRHYLRTAARARDRRDESPRSMQIPRTEYENASAVARN